MRIKAIPATVIASPASGDSSWTSLTARNARSGRP